MKMYHYYDSADGAQSVKFTKLSELIKYIEDFEGDYSVYENSTGIIFENETPILSYYSEKKVLIWSAYEE